MSDDRARMPSSRAPVPPARPSAQARPPAPKKPPVPAVPAPADDEGWPEWMQEGAAAPARPPAARPPAPAPERTGAIRPSPPPPKPAAPKPAPQAAAPPAPKRPSSAAVPAAPPPTSNAALPTPPRTAPSATLPAVSSAGPTAGQSERRKHVRFKPEGVTARFAKGGFLSKIGLSTMEERVVNMSEGGVLLLGKTRLAEGTQISLRIEIPSHQDVIAADAQVRWCCESARHPGESYAGLAFVGLKAVDAAKIAKMREWFTSAEFRARSGTRLRRRPDGAKG